MTALETTDLTHRHPGTRFTLGPVGLSTLPGEIWAVLGPNGAGKSTLFGLLSGQLKPQPGIVYTEGGCELVPQNAAIPGRFTVEHALEYLALLRRIPQRQRSTRISAALAAVGLTNEANHRVRSLSGGQHRRLVIAQALLGSPAVVLMDEPSAGLDLDQREALRQTIDALRPGKTIMVSSHIVEDLAGLADNVLHLSRGKVSFAGTVQDYLGIARPAISASPSSFHADDPTVWTLAYRYWNARETPSPNMETTP